MPSCVAVNCSNQKRKGCGKSFHRFPHRNPALLKDWLVKIRRDCWIPKPCSIICSDHFEEKCFDRTGQTTRLRADAVPTIFRFPAHLIKTSKERKSPFPRDYQEPKKEVPSPDTCTPDYPSATHDSTPSTPESEKEVFAPDICSTNRPRSSNEFTPLRPQPLQDITNNPKTPVKSKSNLQDHNYCVEQSPRTIKRKLDKLFDVASSYKKRLKSSQAKSRRLRKKVDTLQEVVKALEKKKLLSENGVEMLMKTCDVPAEIMKRMVKRRKTDTTTREKYHPSLRSFALTLHFYSAKAYRYVRKVFDLQLPHPSVIRKWYSSIDGNPGFTEEAFRTLEMKAKEARESGHELQCSLMLDEMAIKKVVQWDGNKFHGYVDTGTDNTDDTNPVASDALVFMVVALNQSWKLPVAYFLINGMSGVERANLIEQCLCKLADIGIWIRSLTCDGPSCHLTMLNTLGASMTMPDIRPSFPHPQNPEHRVSVFLDICHMLKLMRNALASYEVFRDDRGQDIKWDYIKELHKLQEDEGLTLGNKLRNAHMNWQRQKMKVNLAAQTLSNSVADALEFLKEQGLPQFQGCEATVKFIRTIDTLFDLLNSRTPFARDFKAPMRQSNEPRWRPFLQEAYSYLSSLTDVRGKKVYTTPRKTAFVGFLVGIKSVQDMYESLVAGDCPKLKYLLTYKMSQDHLELFFCAMRSRFGSNNNPSAREFATMYKKLLIKHEIRGINGNCAAQDNTAILHVSSSIAASTTSTAENDMLLARKYDLSSRDPEQNDHDYADIPNISPLSSYKKAVISYVGGYVVRMTKRHLQCEECLDALTTGELVQGSFLEKRNRGGLVRASPDVIKICETTEKCLQRLLSTTGGDLPQSAGVSHAMCTAVLGEVGLNIFGSLSGHMLDCPPDNNHVYILVKRLTASYLKIRMHHLTRRFNEKLCGPVVRKQLTKLVLFRHQ